MLRFRCSRVGERTQSVWYETCKTLPMVLKLLRFAPPSLPACVRACVRGCVSVCGALYIASCCAGGLILFRVCSSRRVMAHRAYGWVDARPCRCFRIWRLPPCVRTCLGACLRPYVCIIPCFAGGLLLFSIYFARRMREWANESTPSVRLHV